jgi:hypothetical protein
MITLKGPQIHFWIPEKTAEKSEPKPTNSEAGKCICPDQLTGQIPDEDHKPRVLPSYYHVEIF